MKYIIVLFISISTMLLFPSCIRGGENAEENEVIPSNIDTNLKKIISRENIESNIKETIDYSKIKISEDSLDIALFNLVSAQDKYSKNDLLNNIEKLIKKGANPNAVIKYQYSYKKFGAYIPIVKDFYKNKYRTVTTSSTTINVAVNSRKNFLVEKLIELGADINKPDKNEIYPIDIALKNNDKTIVNYLLSNGCNVRNVNLSVSKNIDLIEKLVKLGADAKTIDMDFALSDEALLQRVLKLNIDVNNTKLDYRKIFRNERILDLLLEHGLNDSAKGKFPNTNEPLIYGAIEYGDLNTIKKLEASGINIMQKKRSASIYISPLIEVVESGKADILNYYIENGANVNETDWTKRSVLMFAVSNDDDAIIKILVNAGANKEYTGYFNKTPLMDAVQMNKYIAAQTLIELGANVNYKNKYEETCLSMAIKKKNFPMIKLLVENGVDAKQMKGKMNMAEYAKSVDAQDIIINFLEEKINN